MVSYYSSNNSNVKGIILFSDENRCTALPTSRTVDDVRCTKEEEGGGEINRSFLEAFGKRLAKTFQVGHSAFHICIRLGSKCCDRSLVFEAGALVIPQRHQLRF